MNKITNPKIVVQPTINEKSYHEIKTLEQICQEHDKMKFKLELDFKLRQVQKNNQSLTNPQHFNEFLYYNQDQLIGYIGICDFGGDELEVTGMVHPTFRNHGVFTKLYQLVVTEFQQRQQAIMLLLCHQHSAAGLRYIAKLNPVLHHAEYDMYLNPADFLNNQLLQVAMERSPEAVENLYIGKVGEQVVGQVRIEMRPKTGDIYGLEVVPELRGQGYGRALLNWAIATLIDLGAPQVYLQVDTINANALHLYQSTGFVTADVMEYHAIHK